MMRNSIVLMIVIAIVCSSGAAFAQSVKEAAVDTAAVDESSKHVKRAVFSSAVVDREPVDELNAVAVPAEVVFFFTEIVGFEGKSITHRWVFAGEEKASVSFDIGGPRWRVYSSKKLKPDWVGEWVVEVVDANGAILHKAAFEFKKAE